MRDKTTLAKRIEFVSKLLCYEDGLSYEKIVEYSKPIIRKSSAGNWSITLDYVEVKIDAVKTKVLEFIMDQRYLF